MSHLHQTFRKGPLATTLPTSSLTLLAPAFWNPWMLRGGGWISPPLVNQPNEVRSSQNFQDKFLGVSQDDSTRQGWPHPPSLQSETINVLQVWTSRMGGYCCTSNHTREQKFGTQVKNYIWWSMMSRMTPSLKNPIRNLQQPPSMDGAHLLQLVALF